MVVYCSVDKNCERRISEFGMEVTHTEKFNKAYVPPRGYKRHEGKRTSVLDQYGVRIVSLADASEMKFKCMHYNCRDTAK